MNCFSNQKQLFILERFIKLSQLPTLCVTSQSLKKIILLKNVYSDQKCVMKIQPKNILDTKQRNILHEASFFQKFQGHIGVPLMIWSGQDFDCLVLITEEFGYTIQDRLTFTKSQNKMRIKDVCMIAMQLIDIIKNLHQKDYLHRNISPQSFSFGLGEKITKLYINDLLYMKKYRAKNGLNHIEYKQTSRVQFLTPFLSLNVLKNKQPSRRDDIISIIYLMIYLIKGKLPWQQDWVQQLALKKQSIKQQTQKNGVRVQFPALVKLNQSLNERIQRRITIQESISSEQLCRELPSQIKQILDMTYELQFGQQPQYVRYKSMMNKSLFKARQKNDMLFEWMQSIKVMQNDLKVQDKIYNLKTFKQEQIQKIVYDPYEAGVNVDIYQNQEVDGRQDMQNQQRGNSVSRGNNNKLQNPNNSQQNRLKQSQRSHMQQYHKKKNCQLI